VLFRTGWLIILAGSAIALVLPPGQGTCGLRPVGTNEFCAGNDVSVKLAVLIGSVGTGFTFIALAWWKWIAVAVAGLASVLTGFGVALIVPDGLSCPPGYRLLYGVLEDTRPLCGDVDTLGAAMRLPPMVDHRLPIRGGVVLGGFLLAGSVIVARARSDRDYDVIRPTPLEVEGS
jgi:hypothetical protein